MQISGNFFLEKRREYKIKKIIEEYILLEEKEKLLLGLHNQGNANKFLRRRI